MKKKLLVTSVATLLALTPLATVSYAEEFVPNSEESFQEPNVEVQPYQYVYKGLTIDSVEPLDEEHLQIIYNNVNAAAAKQSHLLRVNPYEGGSTIVDPPGYKTYSNMDVRALVTAATAWITIVLPVTKAVAVGLTGGSFFATEVAAPTYVGTWTYKAYSDYDKRYKLYATLVQFTNDSYTTPIKVQSYPIGFY